MKRLKKGLTKYLIDILNREGTLNSKTETIEPLIELASKNKVLFQLLITLDVKGYLREQQEEAMRKTVYTVKMLSKHLSNYDHAFFKLNKLISYVPADIDVLVKFNEANMVAKKIIKLGYEVAVKEPYCITLVKNSSIIDLYTHPTIGGVIYLNGQELLEHTRITEFNNSYIKTLENYAEALVTATHTVYKEKIYTLNDFFTVKEWASKKTFRLAEELSCVQALKLAININQKIEKGLPEMPYKIPTSLWLSLLLQKLYNDKLTRGTSINILRALTNQRSGNMLISKFTRETY